MKKTRCRAGERYAALCVEGEVEYEYELAPAFLSVGELWEETVKPGRMGEEKKG